jgi:hypothetical protein
VRIVQEGALPALVFLLRSNTELIAQLAAGVLRNLASNLVNQVKIVQEDALPPLLALCRSSKVAVVEQAVGCIRNLSVNAENEVKIVSANGLPVLMQCLRMDDRAVQVCFDPWYVRVCHRVLDAYLRSCSMLSLHHELFL